MPTGSDTPSIVLLMRDFLESSPEAADVLWQRFSPALLRIIRRHLQPQLRVVSDSEDFLQAVWKSIFEHRDRLLQFTTEGAVGAYLAGIAANKVCSATRFQLAAKRRTTRRDHSDRSTPEELIASDATPSQQVIATELKDRLRAGLTPQQRAMFDLRERGETLAEIALRLDVNERTVRRVFERLERQAD
jgi:RNA polymerase sigma factor (sigma-70 family)